MSDVKVVVVGDKWVGKSCFVVTWTYQTVGPGSFSFPGDSMPSYFDSTNISVMVDEVSMNVSLFEAVENEDFKRLRILRYPGTDVFIMSFSIGSQTSFESIQQQWVPEVRQYCPDVPLVLVGMKSDLRTPDPETVGAYSARYFTRGEPQVTTEQGHELAAKIGAVGYFETSSLHRVGIFEVMTAALRSVLCFQQTSRKSSNFSWPWKCSKCIASKDESDS